MVFLFSPLLPLFVILFISLIPKSPNQKKKNPKPGLEELTDEKRYIFSSKCEVKHSRYIFMNWELHSWKVASTGETWELQIFI